MGPKSNELIILKRRGGSQRYRKDGHMKTEAETGERELQRTPKITSKSPEARERQGRILSYRFQKECGPANVLILDF